MFLDASAIVAVLLREEDASIYLKAMEGAKGRLRVSPIARLEAVLALVRDRIERRGKGPAEAGDFAEAADLVNDFLAMVEAREMHISSGMADEAIRALAKYGKMAGHPAKLNMGDALAYACAKAFHVPLLYKGNDFKETDIA